MNLPIAGCHRGGPDVCSRFFNAVAATAKKLARIIAAARAKLISQMFLGLRHRRRFPDSQWPGVDRPYVDNPPR
jgi:hypothetical protein